MNHVEVLLVLMSLFGMASLISRLSRQGLALSFLYAHIAVCFTLYFGGLVHSLALTAEVVRLIGWVSFATLSLPALIANPGAIKRHANAFLFIMLTAFYLQTLTPNYYSFAIVDDYNHWGAVSRIMALYDRFVISSDPISVKDYPPGLANIHYLYTSLVGYRDSLTLFAQGVFVYACLAIPFQMLDRPSGDFRPWAFSLLLLSSLSLTWIFFLGLHTLWADLPLGLLFGLALWVYFSSEDPNISRLLKLAPLLLCMVLMKQMGLVFVALAALILLVDIVFASKKSMIRGAMLIAMLVIVAIVIDSAWKGYLREQGIQRTFQSNFDVIEVFKAFIPAYSTIRQKITIEVFINHFFAKTHFTTYWIILSLVAALGAYKSSPNEKKRSMLFNIGAGYAGLFLYLALLLVLYMFSFSEFEGTRVASLNRYTNTYLLGLLVGFGGVFATNAVSGTIWAAKKRWIGVMAFLFIAPHIGRAVNDMVNSYAGASPRYEAVQIRLQADRVNALTGNDARIYYLWAGGSNDESVIFNYGIYPRTSNRTCSNIRPKGVKIDVSDPWACSIDLGQFEAQLANYDYIFIGRSSEEFKTPFLEPYGVNESATGDLFAITGKPSAIRFQKLAP